MTRMKATFPVFVALISLAPAAEADPIQATYNTTGTIGTTGISGTPDVSFQGVSDGTLTTGQPFSLGQFVVTPPPDGGTTTYATPFQITFNVTSSSGDPALPNATPITFGGSIITEYISDQARLTAIFDSLRPPSPGVSILNAYTDYFTDSGSISYGLYPTMTLISIQPTGQGGGTFDVQAELNVYNAPEPTPLALVFTAGIILCVRRHLCQSRTRKAML
jgi:hypothetical protein